MNLAQRLEKLAQRKADEEAAAEQQEEDMYENGYEEPAMDTSEAIQPESSRTLRNVGRGNEMKKLRGNMETGDDDEDVTEEAEEECAEDEGFTCRQFFFI